MLDKNSFELLEAGNAMASFLANLNLLGFVLPSNIKEAAMLVDSWHRAVHRYRIADAGNNQNGL